MSSNFTAHACMRLKQRTSLSIFELQEILHNNAFVNMGGKPGINKNHLLFFSVRDSDFFVAVVDSLDGDVITIWPVQYHENLGWPVAEADKVYAEKYARSLHQCGHVKPPSLWVFSASYTDCNNTAKVKVIYKQPFDVAPDDFLLSNVPLADKTAHIAKELSNKGVKFQSLDFLLVRESRNADPVVINLRDTN